MQRGGVGGRTHPLAPTLHRSKVCSLGHSLSYIPGLLLPSWPGSRYLSPLQQQRPLEKVVMRGGAAALQSWGGKLAQGAQRGLWGAGLRPGGGRRLISLPRGAVGFS